MCSNSHLLGEPARGAPNRTHLPPCRRRRQHGHEGRLPTWLPPNKRAAEAGGAPPAGGRRYAAAWSWRRRTHRAASPSPTGRRPFPGSGAASSPAGSLFSARKENGLRSFATGGKRESSRYSTASPPPLKQRLAFTRRPSPNRKHGRGCCRRTRLLGRPLALPRGREIGVSEQKKKKNKPPTTLTIDSGEQTTPPPPPPATRM